MSSRAITIIKALYGKELRPSKRQSLLRLFGRRPKLFSHRRNEQMRRVQDLYRVRDQILTKKRVVIASGLAIILLSVLISVFYYNRLTRYEQDVFKEQAKIDSLLQRRRNISVNLARTVRDYALHEQGVFNHVSNMRSVPRVKNENEKNQDQKKGPASQATKNSTGWFNEILSTLSSPLASEFSLESKLDKLIAVAEQYPDLKLSENFRSFMQALVDTEKDLSAARIEYSNIVNTYTTQLRTFPGNLFASMFGFTQLPYYQADQTAKRFRPVDY